MVPRMEARRPAGEAIVHRAAEVGPGELCAAQIDLPERAPRKRARRRSARCRFTSVSTAPVKSCPRRTCPDRSTSSRLVAVPAGTSFPPTLPAGDEAPREQRAARRGGAVVAYRHVTRPEAGSLPRSSGAPPDARAPPAWSVTGRPVTKTSSGSGEKKRRVSARSMAREIEAAQPACRVTPAGKSLDGGVQLREGVMQIHRLMRRSRSCSGGRAAARAIGGLAGGVAGAGPGSTRRRSGPRGGRRIGQLGHCHGRVRTPDTGTLESRSTPRRSEGRPVRLERLPEVRAVVARSPGCSLRRSSPTSAPHGARRRALGRPTLRRGRMRRS